MSNPNPEIVLDESEASKVQQQQQQQQLSGNATVKKKSGFVITSVTDSGHGRPASIVRDGEESADDLDESHASYSDVSYSRTTDADHDQESTASEDTLNISAHESVVPAVDGPNLSNHVGVVPHHPQQPQHAVGQHPGEGNATSKSNPHKDPLQEVKHNSQLTPSSGNANHAQGNTLAKQPSENLESPSELPHDNATSDIIKENKPNTSDKKADNTPPHTLGNEANMINGAIAPNGIEQSHDQTVTINTPTVPTTAGVHLATSNYTNDSEATMIAERPTILTTAVITSTNPMTKTMSATTPLSGIKAPGTRVYKVVKRDAHQLSKRVRGRWTWFDYSDNQNSMIGLVTQPISDSRIPQEGTQMQQLAYPGQLIGPGIGPYTLPNVDTTSSIFKEQLIQAGLSANNSFGTSSINWDDMKQQYAAAYDEEYKQRTLKPDGSLAPEAIRSVMKKYASRTPGDSASGDLSAATQTLKIDNKIEAAMDLVKKHLMSAVRDEVDELKEKIKDLTAENIRLKNESQEILAAIPPEIKSQLPLHNKTDAQANENLPTNDHQPSSLNFQPSSTMENGSHPSTQPNTSEHSLQKGDGSKPASLNSHLQASQVDGKVKVSSANQPQSSSVSLQQRQQDATKVSAAKVVTTMAGQPMAVTQPQALANTLNMQAALAPSVSQTPQAALKPNAEGPKSEADNVLSSKVQQTVKTADINFNKRNAS